MILKKTHHYISSIFLRFSKYYFMFYQSNVLHTICQISHSLYESFLEDEMKLPPISLKKIQIINKKELSIL